MINLKLINTKLFFYILLLCLLSTYSQKILSEEIKIIFKINDKAYTTLDYEKRLEYLDFVGNNSNLSRNLIIKDFISANIFYEFLELSNKKVNLEINKVFENIKKINKENKKKYSYEINKENLLFNIKIDLARKTILENILNSNMENLRLSLDDTDLLYKFTINYINFKSTDDSKIIDKINNLKNKNLIKIKSLLEDNNINYFEKKEEIKNIKKINERIKNIILSNKEFFIFSKNKDISIIFINKSFETYEGLIVDIYSVKSKDEINEKLLKCENLYKLKDKTNIVNKEYNFLDLNNNLKQDLININDYKKIINNDEIIYIILCNIKFDKKILNNFNFNKLINLNADTIEKEFIRKYSKIYNLILLDD